MFFVTKKRFESTRNHLLREIESLNRRLRDAELRIDRLLHRQNWFIQELGYKEVRVKPGSRLVKIDKFDPSVTKR